MAADPRAGLTALNRFGFGARGDGDLAAAASDPRGFLEAELRQPGIALLDGPGLGQTPKLLQGLFAEQERQRRDRENTNRANVALAMQMVQSAEPPVASAPDAAQKPDAKKPPSVEQQAYRAEALVRFQRAASSRAGFVERLVCFWSNHF